LYGHIVIEPPIATKHKSSVVGEVKCVEILTEQNFRDSAVAGIR
jgi:hypothetical protein